MRISLTERGRVDPLLAGMPEAFHAIVGHKEACRVLPDGATLLAAGAACPVQMFRMGKNVYATQFHPELDVAGICTRIEVYKDAGYFDPSEAETLKAQAREVQVRHPMTLLANFVRLHRR